jgi:glycosyltransferase involved in cell wall biosynthesis
LKPGKELAEADVYVSTSLREGFGMTLAESLLVGTPVVAVENRGSRTVASQAEGIVLAPAEATAVSTAVLTQLRARSVEVSRSVTEAWRQETVVGFHVARLLESANF